MIVDLSFVNSVTGSGLVAMCSNILQDRRGGRARLCQIYTHLSFYYLSSM
jgi:hypothetical protein